MRFESRVAQWALASVFLVMGGYRLWLALHGTATSNATLAFSTGEVLLGVLIAAGWRLQPVCLLAAALLVADAVFSHRFWTLAGGAQYAQLLHFMKNIGLVGGLVLLASLATGKRR